MILKKLFLIFSLPAIIWNSSLSGSSHIPPQEPEKFSAWNLLAYENLSYDDIMTFIQVIEYDNPEEFDDLLDIDEVMNFLAFLALNGTPEWNTEAQEEIDQDIEWLFSNDDTQWYLSSLDEATYSFTPAVLYDYNRPDPILCKSWLKKKWEKTKKFVKKHKKTIIVAVVAVTVATIVIVATSGTAAPIVAGAAGAAAADSNEHPHINKPGDVRFQDEPTPENQDPPTFPNHPNTSSENNYTSSPEPIPEPAELPNPGSPPQLTEMHPILQEQKAIIQETIAEQVPTETLNIMPEEQPSCWEKTVDSVRETASILAHETVDKLSESPVPHEKIDDTFGTDFSCLYTPEAKENKPQITEGTLPPPGGGLAKTAGRGAAVAKSSNLLRGAAIVGSGLHQPPAVTAPSQPPIPNTQIDPRLPENPNELLKNSDWVEVSHPDAAQAGHREFENVSSGEKLRFDEGKTGEPGHKGQSHWHRENPNSTSKLDEYLDANDNPVPRHSPESHLYPAE